jgi:hypothetical protein
MLDFLDHTISVPTFYSTITLVELISLVVIAAGIIQSIYNLRETIIDRKASRFMIGRPSIQILAIMRVRLVFIEFCIHLILLAMISILVASPSLQTADGQYLVSIIIAQSSFGLIGFLIELHAGYHLYCQRRVRRNHDIPNPDNSKEF